jgi:hypothetical protein
MLMSVSNSQLSITFIKKMSLKLDLRLQDSIKTKVKYLFFENPSISLKNIWFFRQEVEGLLKESIQITGYWELKILHNFRI